MRTRIKRRRTFRALALAACLASLLAVPSASMAGTQHGYALPPGFTTDGQTSGGQSAIKSSEAVAPVIRTVDSGGQDAVAIVLSSVALALALAATGYVAVRVRPALRSSTGHSA